MKWDDLDLDYVLGEKNWTDGEDEAIWGHESEWGSDDGGDEMPASMTEKENMPLPTPTKRVPTPTKRAKTARSYTCPICNKQYKSPSGFRGHVLKKHDRSDLKGRSKNARRKNI